VGESSSIIIEEERGSNVGHAMMARCVRAGGFSVVAFLLIEAAPMRVARAQGDDAAETAAARSLAVEGLKLADAGKCAEAIDKLGRAEKLHHAPIVLSRLGECQIQQGRLVDGTENLRKVLREPMPPNPSAALTKARDRAQAALDAAKPKIAFITIAVKGPPNNKETTVTVDGQPVSSALLETERPSDPGEHVVEASAPGYLKATTKVTVGPGEKQSTTLKLETDPNYVPPSAAGEAGKSGGTEGAGGIREGFMVVGAGAAPPGPPNRVPAYISWAFGGAALAVGAGFGAVAIKGKNDLENKCNQNQCSQAYEGQLNSAKTAGTISTVAFAVGGAGVILGTVLFFTAGPTSAERTAHGRLEPRIVPRAWVGLNQVGIGADF
jgi:hypothetical protein